MYSSELFLNVLYAYFFIEVDDFEAFPPIHLEESGTHISVSIRMYIRNDEVTLEYDDQVALKFNPRINNFVQQFEDNKGEFIRNTATVTIVDKNRECL